ncbi:MAG: hypothetical protein LCH30_02475 [Proteobacteria bacterium]|nr:hypothetical protein [Pseudomonadota bacterium]
MKKSNLKYLTLLLLALVFIAPGLSAYFYYNHPEWVTAKTTNKGMLLSPPILLSKEMQKGDKWRLILVERNDCEKDCLQELDKLARIRLALGRHLYEVEQWLVIDKEKPNLNELRVQLKTTDIQLRPLEKESIERIPANLHLYPFFIVSPEGYLILAYPKEVKSADIYHDLKQLLKKGS